MNKQRLFRNLNLLVVFTSIGFISSNAFADPKRMFDRVDTDGDGVVSFEEFTAHKGPERRADLDGDGQVTRSEMNEAAAKRSEKMAEKANKHFSKMDLNGDGIVTAEEAKEAVFYRMDKDQDGYLSPDELKRPKRGHGRKGKRQG